MVESIKQLMVEFQEQIPNRESTGWDQWAKYIRTVGTLSENSTNFSDGQPKGTPYYEEFCTRLSELDEHTLKSTYTKFRTCPPTIIFDDIVKKFKVFYKSLYGSDVTISQKMNLDTIIKLLGYTLIVEAVVPDYLTRIDTRFGWA